MDEADDVPPCEKTGSCFLDWWGSEPPDWAHADFPPGWELAFQTYLLAAHVGFDAAAYRTGITTIAEFYDLVDKVGFISAEIKRLENERLADGKDKSNADKRGGAAKRR